MEVVLLAASLIFVLGSVWRLLKHWSIRRRMPPGPIGWPIVGSMLEIPQVLSNPQKFQELVDKYGPVVTLWNGSMATVLISSHQIAREALIEKGAVFASRPQVPSLRLLTNGFKTINSSPYGLYWSATRRNLVSGILSQTMMSNFAQVQERAVESLVLKFAAEADESGGTVVTLSVNVRRALFQILSFICFGRTLEETELDQINALMREATTILHPVLGDFVPLLRGLSSDSQRKEFLVRQNQLFEGLVCKKSIPAHGSYVQTLLSLQEKNLEDVDLDFTVLVRELFIAGADTTTKTVEWTMANLINHPQIQQKVFQEVFQQVGEKNPVKVGDLPKLPYLDAVVKEALRKHPPVYVTAPHAPLEASTLAGYDIPKQCTVLVHLQSLSNDEKVWMNSTEFAPERFAKQPESSKSMNMIPFGAGRRECPGKHLGMLHVHLIVARLVQAFEWKPVGKEVDLTPKAGFTVGMKYPLRASISDRQQFRM